MTGMSRSDRRDESYDNAVRFPQSRQPEPASVRDLQSRLATVRSQRDDAQEKAAVSSQEVESLQGLYQEEQARSEQLLGQYQSATAECQRYIVLYEDAQTQLRYERRSKAGIKGWETRRKRENDRLKQEITEMAYVLRNSLEREDAALTNLEELAARMDRIQALVDSVDDESEDTLLKRLSKLQRIWRTVREILAE